MESNTRADLAVLEHTHASTSINSAESKDIPTMRLRKQLTVWSSDTSGQLSLADGKEQGGIMDVLQTKISIGRWRHCELSESPCGL